MRKVRELRLLIGGVVTALFLLGLSPASASSANISHSYHASTTIANGSLVSLDPSLSDYVEPANSNNGQQLLGIAVANNDSLLAVDAGAGTVQVATSGTANTLVSNLNGPISVGDQVSVSPFNGVGMKAAPGSNVIGLAQTAFNGNTDGASSEQIVSKAGKSKDILVGFVRLGIAIGTGSTQGSDNQLSGLQKLSQQLTGHTVSTVRVLVSLVVAVIALLSLITLVYASIYGGIVSIGRNPLAKYAIFRSMISVLGMVAVIGIIAGGTIFLLLR